MVYSFRGMKSCIFELDQLDGTLSSAPDLALYVGNTGVSPSILPSLARFSRLRGLGIQGTAAWTSPDLAVLFKQHPSLDALRIEGFPALSDEDFDALGSSDVRALSVGDLGKGAGNFFAKLDKLETLSLRGQCKPTITGWQGLRSLRSLDVVNAPLDADDMSAIAALPELRELVLSVYDKQLPAGVFEALAKAPKLARVMLRCRPLSRAEGAALAGLSTLRSLVVPLFDEKSTDALGPLGETKIPLGVTLSPRPVVSDGLLAKLPSLVPELRALDLDQHQVHGYCKAVTPTGLTPIAKLRALEWLNLRGMYVNKLDNDSLAWLPELGALTALSIGGVGKVTAKIVDTLATMKSLRALDLSWLPITDAAVKKLAAVPLKQLFLMKVALTDKGFANLAQLRTLERLEVKLEKGALTDAGVQSLGKLDKLQCFALGSFISKVTPTTLAPLAALPALREFSYAPNDATDVAEAWVTSLCASKSLQLMDLDRMKAGALTDAAVEAALAAPSLECVMIGDWKFSPQARAKLEAAGRPLLGVRWFRPYEPLRPTIARFTEAPWNESQDD